jgi:tryptophan-rich sensory protein
MNLGIGSSLPPLFAAAAFWLAVAILGGLATEIGVWYRALEKPWFQPPDWLFGPAWTLIFLMLAWAVADAWQTAPDTTAQRRLLIAVGLNGALNVAWSVLFFKLKRPDWAFVEVVALWLSIAGMIAIVAPWTSRAAVLMVPYLLWVTFAAVLNRAIVRLNAPF